MVFHIMCCTAGLIRLSFHFITADPMVLKSTPDRPSIFVYTDQLFLYMYKLAHYRA